MPSIRRRLAPPLAVLALVAVAGCGNDSGSSVDGLDPASRVPASAALYGEVVVDPQDDQAEDVAAAARKIFHTDDPGAAIARLIDRSAADAGADVTYARDIAPWLGDRIGFAVTSVAAGKADALAVIASTDDDKARVALAKRKDPGTERRHGDVTYRVDGDGNAYAVADGAVLIGTEPAVRAAIDAAEGDSLADAKGLKDARDELDDDRLGLLYVDGERLLGAIAASGQADPQATAILPLLRNQFPRTLAAAIDADADALSIEAVSLGTPEAATGSGNGAEALAGLPASAVLAVGLGDLGGWIGRNLDQAAAGGLGGIGVEAVLAQLRGQLGLDLREDVLSWMGDAGIYVAGDTPQTIHGGLVVQTSDVAATQRVLAKLETILTASGVPVSRISQSGVEGYEVSPPGAPQIAIALAGERFVLAVGPGALAELTGDGERLGDSDALQDAASKLGDGIEPSFYLSIAQITTLLEAASGGTAEFAEAKPYLDVFGALVAGAKDEGDGVLRVRAAVTLP